MTPREGEIMTRLVDLLAEETVSRRWAYRRIEEVFRGELDEAERRIGIAEEYSP